MEIDSWQTFAHPEFALRFRFPITTPQGQSIEIRESEDEEIRRVHLITEDRQAVYVEITYYANLPAQQAYDRFKRELEQAEEAAHIDELKTVAFGGLPAFEFNFKRGELERAVVLVPRQQALYRLLYNPQSSLNRQILGTVEFL
jgi:hypothetical protein